MNKPCNSKSPPQGGQRPHLLNLNSMAKLEGTIFLKLYLYERCELSNLQLI